MAVAIGRELTSFRRKHFSMLSWCCSKSVNQKIFSKTRMSRRLLRNVSLLLFLTKVYNLCKLGLILRFSSYKMNWSLIFLAPQFSFIQICLFKIMFCTLFCSVHTSYLKGFHHRNVQKLFLCCCFMTDSPMVDELKHLCLSKNDFDVINTIGRGHFGQVGFLRFWNSYKNKSNYKISLDWYCNLSLFCFAF